MTSTDLSELVSTTAAVVAVACYLAIWRHSPGAPSRWWLPVVPLVAFGAWSLYAILDRPLGVWAEHVGTPWETQIWLDLLIMAGLTWALVQPRLRALGSPRLPWLVLIVATGSLGALALVLWLRAAERAAPAVTVTP